MALKRKITKDQYEALAENIRFEYKAGESDGEFVLQTEGDEDIGALKRAHTRTKDALAQSEAKRDELEIRIEKMESNPARKTGDIEALERQWNAEKAESDGKFTAKISALSSRIIDSALNTAAMGLSEKIATTGNAKILLPHIKARISAELDDNDNVVVKVLGQDGKPSDLTIDKLGEEFVANKDYSGIIQGTKASGGAGASNNGGAVHTSNSGNNGGGKLLADLSPQELAERFGAK
ncbi:Phage putative scaffold protein [Xanthomonas phage Suba]|uniref:Phage putative scaffold protein n=1 Tax=Xanthomonas phage Suba TaxID=2674975 RepID=A0A679K3V4_9CAUD|nr:Phage putative scaffold protein [Xanthomonas phage Suba]CAA2409737.1 Phage putative scaffold protein [Xanthomonas phage Suba]